MFNFKDYYNLSERLEMISMIKFGTILLVFIVIGYLIAEKFIQNGIIGIIIGIVLGFIIQYQTYLKEQIKAEEMRMLLEIHSKIIKE